MHERLGLGLGLQALRGGRDAANGECAHFGSDDREATAFVAGTRGFHGRIQRCAPR